MSIFKKIQEQPEHIRKIIFWIIVIILAITFLFAWVESVRVRLEAGRQKNIFDKSKLPNFEEELKNLPKIEPPAIPEPTEEELKQWEEWEKEQMKEAGGETSVPEPAQ